MRSLLLQCFFSWRIKPATDAELATADVIIAASFGYRNHGLGTSNIALARVANQLHQALHIPVIAQHEIAYCLKKPPLLNIREHRMSGKYLDTQEVMEQSYPVCVSHAFTSPIIVAHPDHQWRVMATAKGLGLSPLAADVASVPYDNASAQLWTRNKVLFIFREIPSRLLYLKNGYMR